jgi:hypothetical protein
MSTSPPAVQIASSTNKKSNEILIKKFCREFEEAVVKLTKCVNVSFIEFRNMMYCIGFIDNVRQEDPLLQKAWSLLQTSPS